MTMHYPTHIPMGAANGRHRAANQASSSSTLNAPHSAYLGASGTIEETGYPRTIEEAGIRAGELIGYRAWLLLSDGFLRGMYMTDYKWMPCAIEHAGRINPSWGPGLHAFKSMPDAVRNYGYFANSGAAVVFGEVALWGEVIEHLHGYRAEFAAIRDLTAIWENFAPAKGVKSWKFWKPVGPPRKLSSLRERYLLPALPPSHSTVTDNKGTGQS